jgi:hypothetical protein
MTIKMKMRIRIKQKVQFLILTIALTLNQSQSSLAGIEKLIGNVMPKGTMSNVSKSVIVQDQLAGHLVGGSVLIKTPVQEDLQIANFTPATCKMGGLPCAAQFDLRAGAFSFIKSAEMAKFLKTMVDNAGAYAAIMLTKTICPQCEDIMTWLESVQRDVNGKLNVNCNTMMSAITGPMDKMAKAAQANRQSHLLMTADRMDSAEITQKSLRDNADPTTSNSELKSQLGENFNLVWKALEKKATKSEDAVTLKELLMSISGTIVIQKGYPPKAYGSLVSEDLIEQYIGVRSGSTKVDLYSCDEADRCLNPNSKATTINAKDTIYGKIDLILASMVNKIKSNKNSFTEEEENLISLSSTPLIEKIEMDLATYADSVDVQIRSAEFVEALCYDVVTRHLTKMLQQTALAVTELSYLQITDMGVFESFNEQATNTIRLLSSAKSTAFKRYDLIGQTKARLRQDQNYFEMKFEEYLNNNYLGG